MNGWDMNNWDSLQYFLATAREGSLTSAAQTLGVSNSTIAHRISTLENKLGSRLFEHTVSGLVVTQAGLDMIQTARRVKKEMALLDRQILSRDMTMDGLLRISAPSTSVTAFLMPHIASFIEKHPEVEVDILSSDILASSDNTDADIAIRSVSKPPEELIGKCLAPVTKAVYASSNYLAKHLCTARTIRDSSDHRWVWWGSAGASPLWISKHFPSARPGCRVDTHQALVQAVKHGIGIGELYCKLGDADADLHRLYPFETNQDTSLWALYHHDLIHTARVRTFCLHMVESFAHEQLLASGNERSQPLPGNDYTGRLNLALYPATTPPSDEDKPEDVDEEEDEDENEYASESR